MDKTSSYSWPSVRNFRFSVHTAVQNKRMLWSDHDKIRERAQTFFTHLKAPMPQRLVQAHPVRQTDQGPLDSARYEIIRATVPVIWHKRHTKNITAVVSARATTPCFIARSTSTLSRPLVLVQVKGGLQNSPPTYKLSRFPWPIKYALILERAYPFDSRFHRPAWQSHLKHYEDNKVVEFLTFGWPINWDSTVLPPNTLKNHGSIWTLTYLRSYRINLSVQPIYHDMRDFNPAVYLSVMRLYHDLSFPPSNCTPLILVFPLTLFITSLTS